MKSKHFTLLALVFVLALAGCLPGLGGSSPTPLPQPTIDQSAQGTTVAQTVAVRLTIAALETRLAQPTTPAPLFTATPRSATATSPSIPTTAPVPTQPLATSTPVLPCNQAAFIDDVTYPDGTALAPEQAFIKTWRIKNTGSCAWTNGYALVFASGTKMSGPDSVTLKGSVAPGEIADFSVNLVAPTTAGDYTGEWQFRSAAGETFGTGTPGKPFWVNIKVGVTSTTDPLLANNYCSAVWKNSTSVIGCPVTVPNYDKGSVYLVNAPKLETGATDDEPTIVMIPQNGSDGKISGRFPVFHVESGKHFIGIIGCMYNMLKCSVTMRLSYTTDGGATVTDLQTWNQTYDNSYERIDVDLSALSGKDVQFILTVYNKDGSSADDQAFWLNPQIR